jgi:FKBP-type peptidyl-prolyl cis-trans isomerase
MEKLAAGLKNRKWFALPIHSKRRRKQAVAGKTVSVHYEGSLESGF